MVIKRIKKAAIGMAAIAVLVLATASTPSFATQGPAAPCAQYTDIVGPDSGRPRASLDWVRQECPLLGPVEKIALLSVGGDLEDADPCAR